MYSERKRKESKQRYLLVVRKRIVEVEEFFQPVIEIKTFQIIIQLRMYLLEMSNLILYPKAK
jgi:hypothetical protein